MKGKREMEKINSEELEKLLGGVPLSDEELEKVAGGDSPYIECMDDCKKQFSWQRCNTICSNEFAVYQGDGS